MVSGGQNKISLIRQKFGLLTIVEPAGSNNRGLAKWKCLCDCGNEYTTTGYNLRQGRKKSCGCRNFRLRGPKNPKWSGYEGISGSFWHKVRAGAKSRDIELHITIQEAWELFVKQEGKCALTGVDLEFCVSDAQWRAKEIEQTASLDRIDSKLGYIPGNIQWVHKEINRMKQHYPQERFIEQCNLVAALHRRE